jgi:hypothetical protein
LQLAARRAAIRARPSAIHNMGISKMFEPSTFRRGIVGVFAVAIGCAVSVSADHSWGGYHWARTSSWFTLDVGDNVSSAWDPYLIGAVSDWTASPVLDLDLVAGRTRPRQCKPSPGRIEVCNERYGGTGWLGIAQIWVSGSHITQGIAKMNDTYFNTATYNTPAWRRLVMCQEVAHDFGLDHQDEIFDNVNLGSCMDYTSDPDGPLSNEHPNAHDYEQLEIIYQHLDTTSTVASSTLPGSMPHAMGQPFDTPAQWGRLIRSDARGRVQIYAADFGGGHRVITHVFWADPQADAR